MGLNSALDQSRDRHVLPIAAAPRRLQGRPDGVGIFLGPPRDDRAIQVQLRGKVVAEQAEVDTGPRGDVTGGGAVEALLRKDRFRSVQNQFARVFSGFCDFSVAPGRT